MEQKTGTHIAKFRAYKGREFKLVVVNSYGTGNEGACVSAIRFHGRKAIKPVKFGSKAEEAPKEDTTSGTTAILKAPVDHMHYHDLHLVETGQFADNAVSKRTKTTASRHPKLWKEQCQRENRETGRGRRAAAHPVGAAMVFPNY